MNILAASDSASDADFTEGSYRKLLSLAKKNWDFCQYDNIPWRTRFILWRHDVDFSLNRSLSLARIEHEEGVKATYFVNPHSEFYNVAEQAQYWIIQQILLLGHRLGLHFDAAFHNVRNEAELDLLVEHEARGLEDLFGAKIAAFSFHNPVEAHLVYDAEHCGGLVNCYSQRFKRDVAYCSDSNGLWRHRRLHDVLAAASDPCLQVLTHPGWWQEKPMPPRKRVFRCVYGRAKAVMHFSDRSVASFDRSHHGGLSDHLRFLENADQNLFDLCDFLWNQEHFKTLFIELWGLHQLQIRRLCMAYLLKGWCVPAADVSDFFDSWTAPVENWKLFSVLFEDQWTNVAGVFDTDYESLGETFRELIGGWRYADDDKLEIGCANLCQVMENLATWGIQQSFTYSGLVSLDSIGVAITRTANGGLSERLELVWGEIPVFSKQRWQKFKASLCTETETAPGED